MCLSISNITEQAEALCPVERVALAEVLLESVQVSGALDVEAAWDAELNRRVAEIESGAVVLVRADDVYARAKQLLK